VGPIPCSGEKIRCFATEQAIPSKALGLLPEMTSGLPKSIKKTQKFAKFPVLFPVFRESGPRLEPCFASRNIRRDASLRDAPRTKVKTKFRVTGQIGE
jgi:hypothetical protein